MAQDQPDLLKKIHRESEEREAQRKASAAGLDYFAVGASPVQVEALRLIEEDEARRLRVAPFQLIKGKDLAVAVFDPAAPSVKEIFKKWEGEGYRLKIFVGSLSSLEQIWANYKFIAKKHEMATGKVAIEVGRFQELFKTLTDLKNIQKAIAEFDFKTLPIGQILEVTLAGALRNRASDIHFESEEKAVRLRFRVDGLLHDVVPDLGKEIYESLLSRLKLLSNLKLNVHDQPQDGRFTISLEKKEVEIRLSIIPSEFGETVVMRVLDPSTIQLTLADLGLRPDDLAIVEREIKAPNGMILNTGPTGSGKTTTLYAFLLHRRTPEVKIITVEDPIEYHLEDIEQTQVDPAAGYTFANGLRSVMRQDPDIILVGEIRDEETAGIGVQASLTGHLVFSTVHANSAAGAIPRLLDLKVKPASIGPALNLVIAQRLVRRLCAKCKIASPVSADLKKKIEKFLKELPKRVDRRNYKKITIFKPKGCGQCGDFGYKGRVAIFELLEVGETMEELISVQVTEAAIGRQALKQSTVTMRQDGILKMISGVTTFEEVEGATGPMNW